MQRTFFSIFLLLLVIAAHAQNEEEPRRRPFPGGRCHMVRLTLTDKQGTTGEIHHPEAFLSPRAIARRQRQGIAIDSTDLPVSAAYIERLKSEGADVVCKSKWNNTVVVRGKSMQRLRQLAKLPFIKSMEVVWHSPDSIVVKPRRWSYEYEVNDWGGTSQSTYGATHDQTTTLRGDYLHDLGYTGQGMEIAVLDGGFMNVDRIPAFHKVTIRGVADMVVPQSHNIYAELDHGTKVLSTMAVNISDIYRGAATGAAYWLLRCEDSETEQKVEEDFWASGAEYADSVGVDIITTSLGYHHYDHSEMNYQYHHLDGHSTLISHTASLLAGKGIVMVCSAGNEGMGSWKKINVPADAVDVITVGAVTPNRINAAFSSIGPTADGRVKPDVMAVGSPAAVITGHGTLLRDMGTSFAAPQVAGFIACLWEAHPELTAMQIVNLIRLSAQGADHPDNIFGYGIADFRQAMKKRP